MYSASYSTTSNSDAVTSNQQLCPLHPQKLRSLVGTLSRRRNTSERVFPRKIGGKFHPALSPPLSGSSYLLDDHMPAISLSLKVSADRLVRGVRKSLSQRFLLHNRKHWPVSRYLVSHPSWFKNHLHHSTSAINSSVDSNPLSTSAFFRSLRARVICPFRLLPSKTFHPDRTTCAAYYNFPPNGVDFPDCCLSPSW